MHDRSAFYQQTEMTIRPKHQYTEQEAYDRLSALCASAEHCTADIMKKLREWGVDDGDQQRIINRLTQERYIADDRYARAFIRDKYIYNKWGRNRLTQELKLRHIPMAAICAAMEEIDDEEYNNILTSMLQKKKKSIKARSNYEMRSKLYRFAISHGYTMDEIAAVIGELGESE